MRIPVIRLALWSIALVFFVGLVNEFYPIVKIGKVEVLEESQTKIYIVQKVDGKPPQRVGGTHFVTKIPNVIVSPGHHTFLVEEYPTDSDVITNGPIEVTGNVELGYDYIFSETEEGLELVRLPKR